MIAAIVAPALLWPAASAQKAHHAPRVERLINQAERLAFVLRQRQVRLGQAEALAQGLARNPDLGGAYQAIEGRAWTLIATRRSWFPSLQVVGSTNALRSNEPMLIGRTLTLTDSSRGSSQQEQYTTAGPGVVLNWSFFDARRPAAINQTLESLKAERFLFDIAARNLALNLQVAYTGVQAEAELLQRYEWLLQLTQRQLHTARALVLQGRLRRSAIDQLATEERLQLTRLLDRYQQLFLVSNSLTALVAGQPGQYVLASEPLALQSPWPLGLDATLAQALDLREEIKQKLTLASRDRWAATRAINGYLPVFGLVGVSTLSSKQFLNPENFRWTVFDGGILAAEATALKAQSAQQASDAESQKLLVSKEVMNAFAGFVTARLAVENTGGDFALARRSLEENAKEFASRGDVTTLIQGFNLYISAADKDVGAIRQFNNAVFGLYRTSALWPPGVPEQISARRQQLRR
jgi:outer membrane protein TolC